MKSMTTEQVARLEVRVDGIERQVDKHDQRIENLLLATEKHMMFFRAYHWVAASVFVCVLGVATSFFVGK